MIRLSRDNQSAFHTTSVWIKPFLSCSSRRFSSKTCWERHTITNSRTESICSLANRKRPSRGMSEANRGDKQHFREKQKPAPPLLHDISAWLVRVWRCIFETYTSDNYRAVTLRHFMTHPRKSTHALTHSSKKPKQSCCLSSLYSHYQPLTGGGRGSTAERPVVHNWSTLFI